MADDSTFNFATAGGTPPDAASSLIFNESQAMDFGSIFDTGTNPVDPTNTGDTGANQDISTPPLAGQNNPETAGNSDYGAVINNAINAGFAAWQLASLPKTTPRTVQTQVGQTRVVAGSPSLVSSIFGPSTSQGSNLLVIGIIIIVGILIYKSVAK